MLVLQSANQLNWEQAAWGCAFFVSHLTAGYLADDIVEWELEGLSNARVITYGLPTSWVFLISILLAQIHIIHQASSQKTVLLLLLAVLNLLYAFPPRFKAMNKLRAVSSSINRWVVPFVFIAEPTSIAVITAFWLFLVGCSEAVQYQIEDFYKNLLEGVRIQPAKIKRLHQKVKALKLFCVVVPSLFFLILPFSKAAVASTAASSFALYYIFYRCLYEDPPDSARSSN